MSVSQPLLSRIIDDSDPSVITKYQIDEADFPTEGDRQTFRFIRQYAEQNGGQTPSYATVTTECEHFTYIPAVTDSYDYLVRKLKEDAGKRKLAELFNGKADEKTGKVTPSEIGAKFTELSPEQFKIWLISEMERATIGTHVRNKTGIDLKLEAARFLDEYRARKAGTSFRIWRSKFPSINAAIGGGYLSSNMYTWYARSGRGKSVVTMEEAVEAAFQGATVLVWALEMSAFEWMARAYSSISARSGIVTATIDGVDYAAGFENRALLMGRLDSAFEAELETFAGRLNEILPGRIILRAVDDAGFNERSLRQLEADILATEADVVVVDPVYYMDFEANTSKTAGGDVAATSKKLRLLAGRTKTVIHVITQADENANEKDDDGVRELKAPKRAEIKKTKAVLEDAANVFGIDTLAHEGRGVIEIGKGRNGGEDTRVELLYLPNYGIVRELAAEANPAQFSVKF
ncbi:DnaB-like helicase C-terminal domain-containing protein [Paenibacillus naphthalenovorans]|uniref:DnaB-like helicase C-terminal domain-containing protein n=1 Tax=Paenibacillus naphthalenovorans TaxID=162209 RepID=UPI003D2E061D